MKAKCITDCCGDFWSLTIGKEYEVLEEKDMLLYITNGKEVTEKRILILDDDREPYLFPKTCFEIINPLK